MSILRVLIAAGAINGLLNAVIQAFIYNSRAVPLVTAMWFAIGYVRVFGSQLAAPTFELAFKGVLMSAVWPLLPKRG